MKHVPLRRCVVCREARPQGELLRFYADADGTFQPDPKRRGGGRGLWVCPDNPTCRTIKGLRRTFRSYAEAVAATLAQGAASPTRSSREISDGGIDV